MNGDSAPKPQRPAFAIPSLDGIRALSFMLVFLAHAGFPAIPGGFGVTVFFFLSGYLITTLLRREAEKTGRISLRLFYLRRALRIFPPFYTVLAFALVLTLAGWIGSGFHLPGFVAQALHYSNYWVLAHGWDGLMAGTGVYWSLAVEEHFYLLFPALYLLLLKLRASARLQHALLLALCLVVLLWRCYLVMVQGVVEDRTYIASDTRFDSMLFGCALAIWGNPALDFPPSERPTRFELVAAFGGLLLLVFSFVLREGAFRETLRYSLQGVGLYALFHFAIRYPSWGPIRALNLKPVRFVGTLSYSLYLFHQVVIYKLNASLAFVPTLSRGMLSLLVTFALSLAVWHWVERPCARLRGRFSVG